VKLVRNRIGDIPWPDEDNKRHLGRVDTDTLAYRQLLREKLAEETAELAMASRGHDRDAVLEEAADVYEVLLALLVVHGWGEGTDPRNEVECKLDQAAERKYQERGGFFEGRTYDGPLPADPRGLAANDFQRGWREGAAWRNAVHEEERERATRKETAQQVGHAVGQRCDGSRHHPSGLACDGHNLDTDGIPLKMKPNHQCRLCGRWLEGEWASAPKGGPERTELQRQMSNGRCDPGQCRKRGEP
jgi:phosphoribosyl-ATP pyrophosphohydrolase